LKGLLDKDVQELENRQIDHNQSIEKRWEDTKDTKDSQVDTWDSNISTYNSLQEESQKLTLMEQSVDRISIAISEEEDVNFRKSDGEMRLKIHDKSLLNEQEEWNILHKLEMSILDGSTVRRLRRKLLLRRLKRNLGIKLLDLDAQLRHLLCKRRYLPVVFKSSCQSNNSQSHHHLIHSSTHMLDRYNVMIL
jgi:hypothetical protein